MRPSCFTVLLVLLLAPLARADAQTAMLVRDIGTGESLFPASSSPDGLLAVGSKIFFGAGEPSAGRELWVTDGTASGTEMLSDLCPGECGGAGSFFGGVGGVLFFSAPWDGGSVLWRSDGTRAGTFPLTGSGSLLRISASADTPHWFTFTPHAIVLRACTTELGCELWTSDGTIAGTRLLADVLPGSDGSEPEQITIVGDKAFFVADRHGSPGLWVARLGTGGATRLLGNLGFSVPAALTAAAGKLFFFVPGESTTLWTSDGTPEGTRAIPQLTFGSNAPAGGFWIRAFGNRVYFPADDGAHDLEIWRSDGTAAGTRRLTDFSSPDEFEALYPWNLLELGSRLLFVARDPVRGSTVWATSGTPQSTVPLAKPCQGGFGCSFANTPTTFNKIGQRALFVADDGVLGDEVWATDGTPAGTRPVKDICPGSCNGVGSRSNLWPLPAGGGVLFTAQESASPLDLALWQSDGTAAGTRRLSDPGLQVNEFNPVAVLGQRVFFVANGVYGWELWSTDGQPGGSRLVTDIARNAPGSFPARLAVLGHQLLFTVCAGQDRDIWRSSAQSTEALTQGGLAGSCLREAPTEPLTVAGSSAFFWGRLPDDPDAAILWRTDGTPAGTQSLTSTPQDFSNREESALVAFQGKVYFIADQDGVAEIWTSDGTVAGTRKAFALPAEANAPKYLIPAGGSLYIVTEPPDLGQEDQQLWRSDGTAAGTWKILSGIFEIPFPGGPVHAAPVGSQLFFFGMNRSSSGVLLWKTDGTPAGTAIVETGFGPVEGLQEYQGSLYFFSVSHDPQCCAWGLWRSDGTAAGTSRITTFPFRDPSLSDFSFSLTVFAGKLFFAADDGEHGLELWTSDGTPDGTALVRDLVPGRGDSMPAGLRVIGGTLFFSAADPVHGVELWRSDGTAGGTRLVQDIAPGGASSSPKELTRLGDRLYFSANDGLTGEELWALPLSPGACQPTPTSLCLVGGRFRVEAAWRDFAGNTGVGHAVALTADTGYFWFFSPENVETIVKILDGTGLNGHHWIFYGALSSVEYTLTVTDTQTGLTRRYFNPLGQLASVGDTHGFGPLGAFSAAPPEIRRLRETVAAGEGCQPSSTRLCLNGGRFAVEATWKDFNGNTGAGHAAGLTGDTGYFWFFSDTNVEVVIKVLDGRPLNGSFWVFYGALSNVEYTLRVTDTATGQVKTYTNPAGRFASLGDTAAF